MRKLVETFLLTQPDWVPAQAIAARFCFDERSLRASGKQPGLLSKVAVFSDKGFKHLRYATAAERLACKHRLKREIISRVRRLAVLLAKERSSLEVVNDRDGDLVTFYRCVRFHQEPLLTELEFVLNSRQEFHDFRRQPGLTDIQRAARWFFRNKNCFGGANMDCFGTSAVSGGAAHGSRTARMEAIRALSLRLDRVVIEHLDWQRCIELYDRTETFFFIDPPYTDCKADMYDSWTITDVQRLRGILNNLKGRWLLTLNDTPAIRAVFPDCKVKPVERMRGINNAGGAKTYKELVIHPMSRRGGRST